MEKARKQNPPGGEESPHGRCGNGLTLSFAVGKIFIIDLGDRSRNRPANTSRML